MVGAVTGAMAGGQCSSTIPWPSGQFAGEAASLKALAAVIGGPVVPTVLDVAEQHLLLEDLGPPPPVIEQNTQYWHQFGEMLAAIHDQHGPHHGFTCDTWCGGTQQPNPPTTDGHSFFMHHRLAHQMLLAERQNLLPASTARAIEGIIARVPELIPEQPPSLTHGDLWSGNMLCTSRGEPALIDASSAWCWAETDLAMSCLFGEPPTPFYQAYEACRPQVRGWRQRAPVYQLYHMLNHLNLFGSAYLGSVKNLVNRIGTT